MRLIDADLLLQKRFKDGMIDGNELLVPYNDVVNAIRQAPTVDEVVVRHAYWKETTHITESKRGREIHSKLYNCSYCDAPNGRKKSSYCHWCGAKMDGERRENETCD